MEPPIETPEMAMTPVQFFDSSICCSNQVPNSLPEIHGLWKESSLRLRTLEQHGTARAPDPEPFLGAHPNW